MRTTTKLWRSAIGAGLTFAIVSTAGVAHANEPTGTADETVAAEEAAVAAAQAVDDIVPTEDVVAPVADSDGLVVNTGEATVTVSTDADAPIEFDSSTGESFSFTMPELAAPTDPVVSEDGTIAFGDEESAVSTSVQALDDGGVRAMVVLNDASAPSQYRFDIAVEPGQHLEVFGDGSAGIVDANGAVSVPIGAAWAADAAGVAVPTFYTVEGNTLVQNIDHSSDAVSYPVVADPCWWGWKCAKRIVKGAAGGAIAGGVAGCVMGALPTAWGGGFGCLPGAAGGSIAGGAGGAVAGWWG